MSGKTYLRNQNFFKRNYFEALKYILPGYLYEDDVSGTPKIDDPIDTIINNHIDVAANFSSILNVSAVDDSPFSGIKTVSGISPYFVKQNNLTNITTQNFEDKVLKYFGRKFRDFNTEEEFSTYVENTLLPGINLNTPDTTKFAEVGDASTIHNYLISNLSWMYFLNTSGPSYDPSSYVRDLLVSSLYVGKPVKLNDGIKGLSEHLWKNASGAYYPSSLFSSGTRSDLSGTQSLEKLQTWNDIIYSPLFSDNSDFRVRDKFETYIDSNLKSARKVEDGPFARLIRALSFLAFDINNDTEEISTLYDIDDCPDDFLPLVAQLIGWDLFGNDPVRWRLQLRNAVDIYKTVGTKKSIQSTVNTVFPKDIFPVEGRISELWESYVPYLLYYALATESPKFRSFQTWTPDLASEMGVGMYSTSSMDDNIRLVVDKILEDTIRQFPDNFPINTWLSEFQGVFNYRGRDAIIPPFEEYPYYVNTELSQDMVEFLADRLACFGVSNDFALDVSSYISTNALTKDDEPKLGSWLIFTSGYNEPPNLDSLIRNLNDNRFDYASLWSGKSSHFKLVFETSEFDFTKKNLDTVDSGDALNFACQAVNKVSPAHSIPLISLEISAAPDAIGFESSSLPHIYLDSEELEVAAGANVFTSGLFLRTYKRGIDTGGEAIGRDATQSVVSDQILDAVNIGNIPRNSARRRSFEKIMPTHGYYDRTGFNMPVSFDMSSALSGVPLGLIPSSMSYAAASSYIELPNVWAQCENLNSDNSYFGYDVSNTQNIRGLDANFQKNIDRSTDRGQLPGIYAAMHRIKDRQKYFTADLTVGIPGILDDIAELAPFSATPSVASSISILEDSLANWTSAVTVSYVNSATNGDVEFIADPGDKLKNLYAFPANVDEYYNFEFGRDFHRLYRIYQQKFGWHRLSPEVQELDGANIFSHIFGPLLYNHDFEKLSTTYTDLIASSFISPARLSSLSQPFTGAGSFVASGDDSMYLDTIERVSSGIVDAVELVLTSGTDADSSFSIVRVPKSQKKIFEQDFVFDSTFILMRSGIGAATRLRFDISKYPAESGYPITTNFLSPEHEFKVSLDSLISEDSGATVGGRAVGIWIHTKPESGKMWTYTPEGHWVQHDQLITRSQMMTVYAHTTNIPVKVKGSNSTNYTTDYACLDQITTTRTSPVIGLSSADFNEFSVSFDTKNREIKLPADYQKSYGQLHRPNQNYVVEVFVSPGTRSDQFMLVNKLEIQDLTLKTLSEIFAAGTLNNPLCELTEYTKKCVEYRLELSKQDLFDIFKHFNNIAGKNAATAYASRDKAKTETIMRSEGGSRLDYRYRKSLFDPAETNHAAIDLITIDA